ncbi:hypothetical protein EIN_419420 [Entamoeba invadens IP1]|uniref:Uncharacterized protein n=1 Tax=Entamoeba invadens IP1 TaxID=370355 RepID=A0A0A1U1V0_ENTIV|nr:hypothetical protein EIN_419420 [Entamoeba invadens IP1]ELP88013.1 hypothetical protein EIN_419420 [Entamoeba invadens IP1]|eukprot:XP_004254784.1 hypothetical protein EIN_419420 [Entamoeba invadens IP1]
MKSLLKKNIKQKYVVEIIQASGLKLADNTEVFAKWRRGEKKENHGSLEKGKVHGGVLLYSPAVSIPINCTLFLKKNGYEEKGLELSIWTSTDKPKEICKGVIDLAKFADLNGEKKDCQVDMKGKGQTPKMNITISSGVGVEGGSEDETEVLQIHKDPAQTNMDVHDLLIKEVSKSNHEVKKEKVIKDDISEKEESPDPEKAKERAEKERLEREKEDKEEQELLERQMKQKENKEKEDEAARKKAEEDAKKSEEKPTIFSSVGIKIKGKKEKDSKKKYTQDDIDKAVEKALKEKKAKHKVKKEAMQKQIEKLKQDAAKEKETAIAAKETEVAALTQKVAETEKSKEEVSNKLNASEEENKKKAEELDKTKKDVEEKEKANEELKAKVDETEKAKVAVAAELATSAALVVELKNNNTKKDEEIEELNKKMKAVEESASQGSEELLKQKNEEIAKIKAESLALSQEIEVLKSSQSEKTKEIELENKNSELTTANETLKKQNKDFEAEIMTLKTQKPEEAAPSTVELLVNIYHKNISESEKLTKHIVEEIIGDKTKEISELDELKVLGDSLETSLSLLQSLALLTKQEKVVPVQRDGSLKLQLQDLYVSLFLKTVQYSMEKVNGMIEGMMFDNQCFEKRQAAEFEQVSAEFIPKHLMSLLGKYKKANLNEKLVDQLMVHCVRFVSIKIIELLVQNDTVTYFKGLQLKFFFSILDGEMMENTTLKGYRKWFSSGIDTASLLLIGVSKDKFDYNELKDTLPNISGSIMHAILVKYKADKKTPVDQSILDKIDKTDKPFPKSLEIVY